MDRNKRMTYEQKADEAKAKGIILPAELINKEYTVGIYKLIKTKKGENDYCFYIGKSTNIKSRLLDAGQGHIYMYLTGNLEKNVVSQEIDKWIRDGCEIKVEIEEVDYKDSSFSKAAHRLALAEYQEIVKYQKMGQCEFQKPEGVGKNEEAFWEKNFNENNQKDIDRNH